MIHLGVFHWLSKDFKWIRKGKIESDESFFNKTRYFGFDDAFEAMLACDEYLAEFVEFDNDYLYTDHSMPDMVPVGWSHSKEPIFSGILKEVLDDEHGFPLGNLLWRKGWHLKASLFELDGDTLPKDSLHEPGVTSHAVAFIDTDDGLAINYIELR